MSRKVVFYVTVSLDGYIADEAGKTDWIKLYDVEQTEAASYQKFLTSVDTVLMGRRTYDKINEESETQEWPYSDLKSYIFTHDEMVDLRGIAFVQKRPEKMIQELKEHSGKDIWLCGSSDIANQLIKEGMIDTYHLRIMPVILGGGVPLFNQSHPELQLKVENVQEQGGVIDIEYSDLRQNKADKSASTPLSPQS